MAKKPLLTLLFSLSVLLCGAHHHGLEEATPAQPPEPLLPETAAGVNVDLAVLAQRQHLQELFSRYGENSTLTVEGFRKLLRNMGIEKIKRVTVGHEHHHHHRKHVAPTTHLEKTACPSDASGGTGKDLQKGQAKLVSGVETTKHQSQGAMSSRSTTVPVTTSAVPTATEGQPLLQRPETAEVKTLHAGLHSPSPSSTLGSSNSSVPVSGKANESLSAREAERGSDPSSKRGKPRTQEVRPALLHSGGCSA